jgi:hypothetical protein
LELFPETKKVQGKNTNIKAQSALGRKTFCHIFNEKLGRGYVYGGPRLPVDAKIACKAMKKNINFYSYDADQKKHHQESQVIEDEKYPFIDILLATGISSKGNTQTHAMRILDVEAVTGIHISPHCKSFCMSARKSVAT